ncbi:MAG: pyruvate dehydrogenase (acetyl-transferring) E1 component subunit alpha, partial [Mycobacteriaceae bacterium]|nr:pyruvate dehydrogenase (acetyl-transferring) E1 component subunit alpha [Mycobacteriaceae bacterium]
GVWNERLDERVQSRSARMRRDLRDAVVNASDFPVTDMFDTTYADITPELAAQRRQLLAELAKEA